MKVLLTIILLANFIIIGNTSPLPSDDDNFDATTRMLEETKMFTPFKGMFMYQGDMLLTKEQAMNILQRKMYYDPSMYWKRNSQKKLVINYVFGDEVVDKQVVKESIAEWEKKTCVKFNFLPKPPADRSAHFRFVSDTGCWSYYGMTNNEDDGGHKVSLDTTCDVVAGIHEIGHAMGFYHEHCRSDRDDYVKILYPNIEPSKTYAFDKKGSINHDIPYDYSSNMHYGQMFFTEKGKVTIRALEPLFQTVMGNEAKEMSFYDAKLYNKAYKCMEDWIAECPDLKGKCKNEGYVKKDSQGNCKCECPPNTDGEFCGNWKSTYDDAILKKYFPHSGSVEKEGTISPPKYNETTSGFLAFTKMVVAPECKQVQVKILALDMAGGNCFQESLEIRTDPTTDDSGPVLCDGQAWEGKTFTSKERELHLNYYRMNGDSSGFKAEVKFVKQTAPCTTFSPLTR